MDNVTQTLTGQFAAAARAAPDRVALVYRAGDAVREYNYAQLYRDSLAVAGWLRAQGVEPGDRVALLLENRPEWPESYFGILLAGAVAVPLDPVSRWDYLQHVLEETQARLIFTFPQAPLPQLEQLPFLEKIVVVGETEAAGGKIINFAAVLAAAGIEADLPVVQPGDLASIIYTSGTTGLPKGVMLTHRNFSANCWGVTQLNAIRPDDQVLAILPLHHAFPFTATLLVPLFSRVKITYLDTLKAEAILRCIKEQHITILVLTPQVLQHFYQGMQRQLARLPWPVRPLLMAYLKFSWRVSRSLGFNPAQPLLRRLRGALGEDFRFFISGGAKLPESLAENLSRLGFTVLEGYGLTEAAPVVAVNPPAAPRRGSVGRPLPGVEVRILNPDAAGVGEVLIRGDNVMAGYFHNEAATREVLKDGWLHSGDLGSLDRDGYLYIQGRIKDILVLASGKNVSAEEVGQHYLKAPSIHEIFITTDSRAEKLAALVAPDLDFFRKTGDTDIYDRVKWDLERLSQGLEPYKRVRDFVLINEELPKTRLGKVKIHEAQRLYRERAGRGYEKKQPAAVAGLSPAGQSVVEILTRQTGDSRLSLDDHLELDLGLDSLGLVELLAALESRFNLQIKDEEFTGILTVGELIAFIEGKHPAAAAASKEEITAWSEMLRTDPPPALLQRLGMAGGFTARMVTLGLVSTLGSWFKWMFDLKVYGREGVKPQGYILCPNHASFLDGFLLAYAVPGPLRYHLFSLGYSGYFDVPVLRNLLKLIRVIPVDSARNVVAGLQVSSYILRHGQILAVFPEGFRTPTGEVGQFKRGAAILARELDVKLVPVYIQGSYDAWPPGVTLPRARPIRLIFGREYAWQELKARGLEVNPNAADYDAIRIGLREEVLKLKRALEETGFKSGNLR
ncbi:MAG: AMP-binding protein [Syntrophobacterales bacterium]|jgi:long-chain acyl-CoA synthetase|nr:AMP-binding protein [Syntrophobacterales bacterium]